MKRVSSARASILGKSVLKARKKHGGHSQAAFSPNGRKPFLEAAINEMLSPPSAHSSSHNVNDDPANISALDRQSVQKNFQIRKQSKHIRWHSTKNGQQQSKRSTSNFSQRKSVSNGSAGGPTKNTVTAIKIYK